MRSVCACSVSVRNLAGLVCGLGVLGDARAERRHTVNDHRTRLLRPWPLLILLLLSVLPTRAQVIVRGPYVQLGTPTSIVVRWRTDVASDSRVSFGSAPETLASFRDEATVTTEHEVKLDGLTPDARYYYSVGSTTQVLAGGDANHFFQTSPTPGMRRPYRIWVLGDSGTGNSNARAVRDAYASFNGSRFTDLWLMLGDNAYADGTDAEYQTKLFDIYPQWLRQSVLWPTLGNHDGHSASSATQTGPYYDSFTMPRAGEAGGVASGTEAYYSFDYGNIHFICLDSYDSDRAPGGAMLTWLEQDLAANTRDWTVAYWHHPPYSKGSHDSDTSSGLTEMRENALPILEAWGVDLVLSGHSHAYERSFLLDSHYGVSSTLTESMKLDAGDGRTDGTGAYSKPTAGPAPHEGAVYVVAGSSGSASGGSLDHPAMFLSLNVLGSVVLDVDGDRLDASFLDSAGTVRDHFTVLKNAGDGPRASFSASPTSGAAPLQVTFADLSTRASSWAWDFDNDGTTDSTQRNPSHTYASPGTYSVRLSVTGATGSDDEIKTGYITVASPPVCGNGIREDGEQCDGADLGGATCASQNCAGGMPNCSASCTLSYASCNLCQVCGDGIQAAFQDGVSPTAGYAGTIDTYLDQSAPTQNLGSSTLLSADGDDGGGQDRSALLRWDVSTIPAGSVVRCVILTFEVTNRCTQAYGVYELKRDWLEDQATWNESAAGSRWEVAGALGASDRGTVALGTIDAPDLGTHSFTLNEAGLALVQSWVDEPATNHGILLGDLTNADGLGLSSRENATATLRPKLTVTYAAPLPTLTIAATDPFAAEAGPDPGTFTLTRDGDLSSALTVEYRIAGSATNGVDYGLIGASVVFGAGSSSAMVTIAPIDDLVPDAEDVELILVPGVSYLVGTPGSATLTIADDDAPPPAVTLSFQDGVSPTAGYAGTIDTYLSQRKPTLNQGASAVLWADGDDLDGLDQSVLLRWDVSTIPAGSVVQSASLTFDVMNRSVQSYGVYELKRDWLEDQATWNEGGAGSGWEVAGALGASDRGAEVLGTIDAPDLGTRAIALNGAGLALVQSWVDQPATNHGIILADPTNTDGLGLNSRENPTATLRPRLTVTYAAPLPTVTIVATDPTAAEAGPDPGTFTLTRDGDLSSALSVEYAIAGSATNGVDYQQIGTAVVFAAGSSSASVTIEPIDDLVVDAEEVELSLVPGPSYVVGAPASAAVTILDDDAPPPPPVTLSFQDGVAPTEGYAGTIDTYVSQRKPTLNLGASAVLWADGDDIDGLDQSVLLRWDISTIPAGSVVRSATLTFEVTNRSAESYGVYELKRDWLEDQATWNESAAGSGWELAGALGASDRGAEVLADIDAPDLGMQTFSLNGAGLALVQSWVDAPATNHGIILADSANTNGLGLSSRENATATLRPKLTITYGAP